MLQYTASSNTLSQSCTSLLPTKTNIHIIYKQVDKEGASLYQQLIDGAKSRDAEGIADSEGRKNVRQGREDAEEELAKSHECQSCGYTLFVAKGREWKFFGKDHAGMRTTDFLPVGRKG